MNKNSIPSKSGIYTILVSVNQPLRIQVGSLGYKIFPVGIYTYTGSAIGKSISLRTRVCRHFSSNKKLHWHIDYLLTSKNVEVKGISYLETSDKKECQVANHIENLLDAKVLIRGFGSSDCLYKCTSHLHYFPNLDFDGVRSLIENVYQRESDIC